MSKIRVMPPELSNRIAAGEVIERPASVVKELVENSLDAGAGRITVSVERAGLHRIEVADDGCGMDAEDAVLSLETHGTSKLLSGDGIEHISTLGFRGEAIPSIAAVSRMTIRTRCADAAEGTQLVVEGGKLLSCTPCGGAVGTTTEVRDLFFNTPARKKFLKSDPTEEHHIEETLIHLALGNCRAGFTLLIDRKKVFSCAPGATPELRVREFFGRSFAANMKKIAHAEGAIRISGLTAAPGFTRPGRREQRIYLNGRPIESLPVWRGIREGYGTLENEAGRFPPTVLFLEMPPEDFDVNVHPAKREVRFKSDYSVVRAVTAAIRRALHEESPAVSPAAEKTSVLPPTIGVEEILRAAETVYRVEEARQEELVPVAEIKTNTPGNAPETEKSPVVPVAEAPDGEGFLTDRAAGNEPVVKIRAAIPDEAVFSGQWPDRVLGVYDDTYILAAGGGALIVVDQHAAHERILFEEILDHLEQGDPFSQLLLIGKVLELPPAKAALLLRHRDVFVRLGFDFEDMGGKSVIVNAIPGCFGNHAAPIDDIVEEMLDELLENARAQLPVNPEFAARAACKAAVKAHWVLSVEEATELL
ncbi:MAG: DNA mismatch repair endonuclease MutL, partial [Victivallaceae bacterium]|nr:DNA mismatch repair endonuclease MutL [Victivallaceae bacterium]